MILAAPDSWSDLWIGFDHRIRYNVRPYQHELERRQ